MVRIAIVLICFWLKITLSGIAYAQLAEEHTNLSVTPMEQHNVNISIDFFLNPSPQERLILTCFSMEIIHRTVFDSNLPELTTYGWFLKKGKKNQFWIGKVVAAGEEKASLSVTLPALKEDDSQRALDPAKYKLFLSFEPSEGLPAFLHKNTLGTMFYLPIKKASLSLTGDLQQDSMSEWVGWQRTGNNTFTWDSSRSKDKRLYAVFQWIPPYDRYIVTIVTLIGSLTVGLLISSRLFKGLDSRKSTCLRWSLSLLITAAALIAIRNGWISILVALGFLAAAVGLLIGPILPTRVRETMESISG